MTTRQSNTAQIRTKLDMAFDDSALSAFCFDYFPKVYDRFSRGMGKDDKITYLLDYCRRHPTGFEMLLDHVREAYKMSNFQREELKPLIDALSVYIDSSPQTEDTTKPSVGSGSHHTQTEPKVGKTMTTSVGALAMVAFLPLLIIILITLSITSNILSKRYIRHRYP